MEFYVLASGSKGNATLIASNGHVILVDMGVGIHYFKEQLAATPYQMEDIEAIFVTHDHSDHTNGLRFFPSSLFYAAEGTCSLCEDHILVPYENYDLYGFHITILPTSHDAINPIGFVFDDGEEKLVYMTDTGYVSEKNLQYMRNADYYIFESNHNVRMLLATNRPYELKQRILGDEGHLSNEDSALYLSECVGPRTKEIVLAHLSEEANSPEKALEAYLRIFRQRYQNIDLYQIRTASQRSMLKGGRGKKETFSC